MRARVSVSARALIDWWLVAGGVGGTIGNQSPTSVLRILAGITVKYTQLQDSNMGMRLEG